MFILGVSCFYHDSAAALLQDGVVIAAAEEERFSRLKHDSSYPKLAIQFCLDEAGISAEDLDYVVFYEKPMAKFDRILRTNLSTFPKSWRSFGEAMISWTSEKLWVKSVLQTEIGVPANKILFVDHHMSHAASAFFASPFKDAAVLTIDGVGEWTTATRGYATSDLGGAGENKINLMHEQRFPHSLGLLYSAFTAFLGFRVNNGEYKVMGMSPYGDPNYMEKIHKLFKVYDDGSFWMDMDYFDYHYSPDRTFSDKFVKLFGEPRIHDADFYTAKTNPEMDPKNPKVQENQYYADIAASIQRVTEETVLTMLRALHKETGADSVVMAGGVALNSKGNGRLLRESPFEHIFIQPAAGDSGGALGAALYAYHVLLGKKREWVMDTSYFGAKHSMDSIISAARKSGFAYEQIEDEKQLTECIVDDILAGKVISFYQDRFEWGPRALGHRSIMADPRRAEMKDIVNTKIKFREPFRPFAPVIPEENVHEYFDIHPGELETMARYMLVVVPFKEGPGAKVPAVNHLGTGRLQVVRREWNPRYYDLVKTFGEATGVPILINTSFNLRGEPIVNTPENALSTFGNSGIDSLIMENVIVRKPN